MAEPNQRRRTSDLFISGSSIFHFSGDIDAAANRSCDRAGGGVHRHYPLNGVPGLARYVQLVTNMNAANDQNAVIFLDLTGHMTEEIFWSD